ncbi:MAG: HAD family hydrolase [Firmicutes bacterium]|nr:HAD family hydrolase [Bacillota bacterium]MDD7601955.1 HAD family hydrolase [Bacillota bacterium]MDY5855971.1 HAD family hydrolase [Anaerovoracaceae bacterium]
MIEKDRHQRKAVIFDLDGTLWDSSQQIVEAWNPVLRVHGKEITVEQMCGFMGKTLTVIGSLIFPDKTEKEYMKIMAECSKAEHPYVRQHGGVLYLHLEEVLKELSRNFFLAIVSNCQDGYVQAFLDHYEFWKYFDDIEMAGRTGRSKGENISLVVKRNHIEKAVYVGDTSGDQEAAKLAGVPFIYAAYGFGDVSSPDFMINQISDLLSALKEILM